MPTSSNIEDPNICKLCGGESQCQNLGVIKYAVPVSDPRFGKLFRCPNFPVEQDQGRQEQLRKISNLDAFQDKSFETFQTDISMFTYAEQQSLQNALRQATKFAVTTEGWLLLEGGYGCGKTHLAAAIGNARLKKGETVLFITSPDLLDHLRGAYAPEAETSYDEMFDRVRNADLLILDDLGVEKPSPWAHEKLFQLLNHRYTHNLPTVITTNTDIDKLDQRIRSRLLDTTRTHRCVITAPDFRSLAANDRTQLSSSLNLYREMTFESFELGPELIPDERANLKKAHDIAVSYAQNPDHFWLVLTGKYGSGKTHLAAAIANYRQMLNEEVMFITVPDLMDYLRTTYGSDADVSFNHRFQKVRNVPLLVLDDLGTENPSAWAKEKLFQIIDYRYVARIPTVITTGKTIEDIDERLRVRLLDSRRAIIFAITARGYALRRRPRQ
jgi:DNA replication protein DnaC